MTTDLALLGRLGDHVVAAAALAHTVLFAAFVLGMGLVSAVAPLAAQAFGARNPRVVRRALRVGLWAAVLLGVPLSALQFYGREILLALGQTDAGGDARRRAICTGCLEHDPGLVVHRAARLHGRGEPAGARPLDHARRDPGQCAAGLWPDLRRISACRSSTCWAPALRPRSSISACARPRSGCATRCVRSGNIACSAASGGRTGRCSAKLIVVGAPISGTFSLEYGVFAAAGMLMGWIGTSALAAHQIALQIASIMFMVPFGISMAATVRVGHAVGRRDSAGTRSAGFVAIWLGIVFMTAMTLLVIATREMLPILFLGSETTDKTQTAALAATLLVVGASFFIADGMQTVAQGALRGLNDTAHAAALFAHLLLADRASRPAMGSASRWASARSASGSRCRSRSLSMRVMLVLRFHRLTRSADICLTYRRQSELAIED